MVDLGEGPPPLFLDQTEARRAEKIFFGDSTPTSSLLSKGLDDSPHPLPPLSQGLDPALMIACTQTLCYSFRSFGGKHRCMRERGEHPFSLAVNKSPAVYFLSRVLDGL